MGDGERSVDYARAFDAARRLVGANRGWRQTLRRGVAPTAGEPGLLPGNRDNRAALPTRVGRDEFLAAGTDSDQLAFESVGRRRAVESRQRQRSRGYAAAWLDRLHL